MEDTGATLARRCCMTCCTHRYLTFRLKKSFGARSSHTTLSVISRVHLVWRERRAHKCFNVHGSMKDAVEKSPILNDDHGLKSKTTTGEEQ